MHWLWKAEPLQPGSAGHRTWFRMLWCYVGAAIAALWLSYADCFTSAGPTQETALILVLLLGPVVMAVLGYVFDTHRLRRRSPQSQRDDVG